VPLPAGDVHVWELSNAQMDAGEKRPRLIVKGNQLVRLVALDRAGDVLADSTAEGHELPLPRGTARLAAAGLGWPGKQGERLDGLAGWHAATALRQIDDNSYLGPRCVLVATSAETLRARRPVSTAVVRASEAVFGRASVTTRLPAGARTLLIVLETAEDPDDALSGITLGLRGASRTPAPPRVVVSGTRVHGLFDLRPETAARRGLEVTIASQERWRLAGVLAAAQGGEDTAYQLMTRGLEGIVAEQEASGTGTSELRWSEEG
jgi:hypothetical protein